MNPLYSTRVENINGTQGSIKTSEGQVLKTGGASATAEGYNPEQFIGMAWSTCLHATLLSVMKARKLEAQTRVYVDVDLFQEEKTKAYYFVVNAHVAVEGLSVEETEKIAQQAHRLCPVSKLIHENPHVAIHAEKF